ncbi:MgtC/SapB family protein [Paenibacillus doosanensis]|nr:MULTISPECIES: MgtC/SapB family protein [Paenibacillus]MCS7463362.1 MgtC/SapB family protein [Paenibacillus doosanensis]
MYVKITVSAVLGLFIGWDRSYNHKPAGLKTYTYTCVACTLITIVSIYTAHTYNIPGQQSTADPLRLTAQIVSGLGFIGAGVILKDGEKVKGLTSAAMIFFSGGAGIGIGAGYYGIVIFSVMITFLLAKCSRFLQAKHSTDAAKMESTDVQ